MNDWITIELRIDFKPDTKDEAESFREFCRALALLAQHTPYDIKVEESQPTDIEITP